MHSLCSSTATQISQSRTRFERSVYDDHPDWIYPNRLQSDETIRNIFIDAYTLHSDTNWTDYWYTIWNTTEKIERYLEYGYSLPNTTNPIIWGSKAGYGTTKQSQNLVDNLMDGELNWSFVALGSESDLTALVQDLYTKQLPFIANLYSPHADFATSISTGHNDTEYMEFEKIYLPRNQKNSVHSTCYVDGSCAYTLSAIPILANPNLPDTFPEIYDFALNFAMKTQDVSSVISFHSALDEEEDWNLNLNLTEHEKWQYAACQWLKLNSTQSTIELWFHDITRYDCIFDDSDNCGFDYYYDSYDDAVNNKSALTIPWDDSIAGNCLYDSNEPICECPEKYFVGDSCRTSCDGVIGPILNDNYDGDYLNASRFVSSENFAFYICSGHGICDIDHKSCECEDGYGGAGCEVEYTVFSYPMGMVILWSTLFFICIIVLSLSMYWIHTNREYKTIKALSPSLVYVFTIGLILFTIGNMLYLIHPFNDTICILYTYIRGIGGMI